MNILLTALRLAAIALLIGITAILIVTIVRDVKENQPLPSIIKQEAFQLLREGQVKRAMYVDIYGDDYSLELILNDERTVVHAFDSKQDKEDFKPALEESNPDISFAQVYRSMKKEWEVWGDGAIAALITLISIASALAVILWFLALYDLLGNEFIVPQNKWVWLIALLLLSVPTCFFYWPIAKRQQHPRVEPPASAP